jgi:hypothetical protein
MDFCDAVVSDTDGNIYATGFYRSDKFTIENQELPWVDNMDSFLAKFDKNGKLIWVIPFYGVGVFDRTEALVLDNDGNVLLLSNIEETYMIGDQLTINNPKNNSVDVILMKFNPDGQLQWHKIFNGPATEIGYRMIKSDNHIFIGGQFSSTLTIGDITLTSNGGGDMYISKLDLDGNVIWAKGYGGSGTDRIYQIDTYSNGDIGICGYSTGEWTFGSTDLNKGEGTFQGFWGKIDKDGNPIWARQILNTSNERAQINDLAIDNNDNTCIATYLEGNNSIEGMTFSGASNTQFAMVNYDINGDISWLNIAEMNASDDRTLASEIVFHNGNYWLCGSIGSGIGLFGKTFEDIDTSTFYFAVINPEGNLIADFYEPSPGESQCWGMTLEGNKVIAPLWVNGEITINGSTYDTDDYDIILSKIDFENTVAVKELNKEVLVLNIFPNPVKDILHLQHSKNDFTSLQVIDNQGNVVLNYSQLKDDQIQLTHLPAGKYYLRMMNDRNIIVKAFVKI